MCVFSVHAGAVPAWCPVWPHHSPCRAAVNFVPGAWPTRATVSARVLACDVVVPVARPGPPYLQVSPAGSMVCARRVSMKKSPTGGLVVSDEAKGGQQALVGVVGVGGVGGKVGVVAEAAAAAFPFSVGGVVVDQVQ